MSIPSRVLSSGNSGLATTSICGDAATALTAAGSNQATALQLSAVYNTVGTTASSTGVLLPPSEAGAMVTVHNDGANTLQVYAPVGSTIDTIASATGVSIATTKRRLFICTSSTTWSSLLGA